MALRPFRSSALLFALLFVAGCIRSGYETSDASSGRDGSTVDASPVDASPTDTSPTDASPIDALSGVETMPDAGVPFLTNLVPSQGTLSPAFSPATLTYTLSVGLWVDNVSLTPTAPGAEITVNGQALASGETSDPLILALGGNWVSVVVSSAGATSTYTVIVNRAAGVIDYLKTSNMGAGDHLGASVALSGDTLVVASNLEDSDATGAGGDQLSEAANNSGAVYVFTRTAGVWTQQAYLKPSNTDERDFFGVALSLSGDTLAVGADGENGGATGVNGDDLDNSAADSGAVYIFRRTGSTWSQEAYIKASNTEAGDEFGQSLSLSGDTLAVGAHFEDSNAMGVDGDGLNNAALESGAVYVFTRVGTTWSQQAYLKASNTEASDEFGQSVSLSGDTLAVGAHREDSSATGVNGNELHNETSNSGAVYVFVRSGTTWSQEAYLKASNTGSGDQGSGDQFGWSVSLSANTLAVGARYEQSIATGVDGDQTDNSADSAGAVYIFTRTGNTWSQEAYLKAFDTMQWDVFGHRVSLSGDYLAVAAPYENSSSTGINNNPNDNSADDSGAVYVFGRTGTTWSQKAYLKASNTQALDHFGWSLSLSGNTLAVGANLEDGGSTGMNGNLGDNTANEAGAVYIFD